MRAWILVIVASIGIAAGASDSLKDSKGNPLIPVAPLKCVPLFEIKDVRMQLFRTADGKDYAIAVKVVFVHHYNNPLAVSITIDMTEMSGAFADTNLSTVVRRVLPNTPTTAYVLAEKARMSGPGGAVFRAATFTPHISFAYSHATGPAE